MISVMSSNREEGVSGRFLMAPDFFSRSASAFLKGVGVRGVSLGNRLLGVDVMSEVEQDAIGSNLIMAGRPRGVLKGL